MKELTVGELRAALKDVPDHLAVRITSDSGVDQGGDMCVVEEAKRIRYSLDNNKLIPESIRMVDYFSIYANYYDNDEDE